MSRGELQMRMFALLDGVEKLGLAVQIVNIRISFAHLQQGFDASAGYHRFFSLSGNV